MSGKQIVSGDPDQPPHSVVSGLGLHYWPTSHKKDARLYWLNLKLLVFLGILHVFRF